MSKLNYKKIFTILFLLVFSVCAFAQTPQYYNLNTGTSSNSFPFNMAGGKAVNSLFLAGEFNQPTPLPAGQRITAVYFRTSTAGTRAYTNLHILLKQDTIITLTSGAFYSGVMDTVFVGDTSLTSTASGWMKVTLENKFNYDPTKSLIMFVGQCGTTGSGGSVYNSSLTGIRRVWSVGGCPFAPYAGGDVSMVNFGVDVEPAAPLTCSKIAGTWCGLSTYPSMPGATYFNASAWIGDTLYVQAPTSAGVGATTMYKYTYNGAWSTGVPCPVGVVGASMTAAGGKLYLIGGGTASITTGTTNVQEYNPATGSWATKAPLPVPLAAHGSVCWGDSVIFVVGGPYTGAGTNLDVHYYRVASNTWGTISGSLPSGQGRRTFALSIADGNKIFMSCGYNTTYLKSTYIGTINSATSITWTAAPDAPTSLSRPAGTAYGKFGFVVGGDTNLTAGKNPKVFVFNTQTNTWLAPILNNPNPVSNMMNAVTMKCINDTARIFQPGGYTTVGTANLVVTGCGPILVGNANNTTVLPEKYSLFQNYPNPFNPVTKISYAIPKSGLVTLRVYDILGREVATLVNEVKTAGNFTVDFNASNFSSGAYFYRLESNGFVDTKKMMVIK